MLPPPPPATLLERRSVPECSDGRGKHTRHSGCDESCPAGRFYRDLLSSNNPIATVPASVTVPAGESNVAFSVSTASVTVTTGMTIFATAGGLTRLTPLYVNPAAAPPPPPVTTVALTVNATGRSGERVTSSPAGINVAVGSSMQASFNSGTSITLSVSNGRDAIWSGACSSGGNKRKTCTFTLNAAGTVTANVQ